MWRSGSRPLALVQLLDQAPLTAGSRDSRSNAQASCEAAVRVPRPAPSSARRAAPGSSSGAVLMRRSAASPARPRPRPRPDRRRGLRRRRGVRESNSNSCRSTSSYNRSYRAWGPCPASARCRNGSSDSRLSLNASSSVSVSRSSSSCAPPSRPNTTRKMISSVTRCSRGCSSIASSPGPARELALGQVRHQARQPLHTLAVERGQHQSPLLHVRVLVEENHGVAAHDRFQDAHALTGVQHVGRRHEHLLDLLRIGQHDERGLAEYAQGEAPSIARTAALEQSSGALPGYDRLPGNRLAWPGRQLSSVVAVHDAPSRSPIVYNLLMSISTNQYLTRLN